jgi:hypothetical protein
MPKQVVMGATMKCMFGVAPSSLIVLPANRVLVNFMPAANIMDFMPMVNILPFGMCSSPSNPAVMAATIAASGVLTPMPCIPVIPLPWTPGSPTVIIGYLPALNDTSYNMCQWGGIITITNPGQMTTDIP